MRRSERSWTDCICEKSRIDSHSELLDFGFHSPGCVLWEEWGWNFAPGSDFHCVFPSKSHFHCERLFHCWNSDLVFHHVEDSRTCDSERNNHLLAALQSAASPAGRTWVWMSTPTRCFQLRYVRKARTSFPLGFLVLLFPPLWPGKPAFAPSPPRRIVFLRGSCPGGATGDAMLPPSPCCPESQGYQGGACWSPLTWRGRQTAVQFFAKLISILR